MEKSSELLRIPSQEDLADFDAVVKFFGPMLEGAVSNTISKCRGNPRIERDDLYQEALLAVVNAVRLYDPAKGCFFSVYLKRAIQNRLKMYVRDTSPHHYRKHPEVEGKFIYVPVRVDSLDDDWNEGSSAE